MLRNLSPRRRTGPVLGFILARLALLGRRLLFRLFSLGNLIQVPGLVFLGAAVLALGKVWGGVATYLAAMSSCLITFLAIGLLGGSALRVMGRS